MTAFYPLRITADWPTHAIHAAVAEIAADLGFHSTSTLFDFHETDAQSVIDDLVRAHRITRPDALIQLSLQRSLLLEQYERIEYRWENEEGEIALLLANDNVIPFPENDIRNSGHIRFACGWVEFVMPDRRIEQMRIDDRVRNLPLFMDANSC